MITISELTVNKKSQKINWDQFDHINRLITSFKITLSGPHCNLVLFFSLDNRCEFGRNKIGRNKIWKGKDELVEFAMLAEKRMKIN
jgi:hypothetical protein